MEERSRALNSRLISSLNARQSELKERVAGLGATLRALSPEAVFQRGFSLTLDSEGNPITDATSVESGDRVLTRLARGQFESVAE
jgi:exodeoxyribonuclease VII large subunit